MDGLRCRRLSVAAQNRSLCEEVSPSADRTQGRCTIADAKTSPNIGNWIPPCPHSKSRLVSYSGERGAPAIIPMRSPAGNGFTSTANTPSAPISPAPSSSVPRLTSTIETFCPTGPCPVTRVAPGSSGKSRLNRIGAVENKEMGDGDGGDAVSKRGTSSVGVGKGDSAMIRGEVSVDPGVANGLLNVSGREIAGEIQAESTARTRNDNNS
jgi:hypothetical protein